MTEFRPRAITAPRLLAGSAALAAAVLLAACGGGDDDWNDNGRRDNLLTRDNYEAVASAAADTLNLDLDTLNSTVQLADTLAALKLTGPNLSNVTGCAGGGQVGMQISNRNGNGVFDAGDDATFIYTNCQPSSGAAAINGTLRMSATGPMTVDGNGLVQAGSFDVNNDWRVGNQLFSGAVNVIWSGANAQLAYDRMQTTHGNSRVVYSHRNAIQVVSSDPLTYSQNVSGPMQWRNGDFNIGTQQAVITSVDRNDNRNHQSGQMRVTDSAGGYANMGINNNQLALALYPAY